VEKIPSGLNNISFATDKMFSDTNKVSFAANKISSPQKHFVRFKTTSFSASQNLVCDGQKLFLARTNLVSVDQKFVFEKQMFVLS